MEAENTNNKMLNKEVQTFFLSPIEEFTFKNISKAFNLNAINPIDKKDKNNYGNLLHAAVQNKFDEQKVFQFISVLLENEYDVNYKSKYTGYNFIQLALYGYTDKNNKEHSYSTNFLLKLIEIAKEHNLDVNTKDNDGDSIIHTALASEVYTGEVLPLIDALGEDFNLECKDKKGNKLLSALNLYKKEAQNSKNDSWFKRLAQEEESLKARLNSNQIDEQKVEVFDNDNGNKQNDIEEKQEKLENETRNDILSSTIKVEKESQNLETITSDKTFTINEIISKEEEIMIELEKMIENIDFKYIITNKNKILSLKTELNTILEKKASFTKKESNFDNIWKKYEKLFKKIIEKEINKLINPLNITALNTIKDEIRDYNFADEIDLIHEIIEKNQKLIDNSKNELEKKLISQKEYSNIEQESEFNVIFEKYKELKALLQKAIEKLDDSIDVTQLENIKHKLKICNFDKEIKLVNKLIKEYKNKLEKIENKIKEELTISTKENFINEISSLKNQNKIQLLTILESTEKELLSAISEINEQNKIIINLLGEVEQLDYTTISLPKLKEIIKENNRLITNKKKEKLNDYLKEIFELNNKDNFEIDEIWNLLETSIISKNNVKKRKK